MRRADLYLRVVTLLALMLGASGPCIEALAQVPAAAARKARSVVNLAVSLAEAQTSGRYLGAGSCAAANCHGGHGPATRGSEYAVWCQSDPHAMAHQTLLSQKSRDIARKLGLSSATRSAVCTNCHGPDLATHWLATRDVTLAEDGVSCETCHGAAEHWIEPHKRTAGARRWSAMGTAQKAALGFLDTKDLAIRARICASCHVGAPGRDVNHDLIAAGHPRLHFELSAYQRLMPAHWNVAAERSRVPAHDARLWLVGQVVSARSALRLLAWRAGAEDLEPETSHLESSLPAVATAAAWPELAEFACYRCHHDLAQPGWRIERRPSDAAGKPAWGRWHLSTLEMLGGNLFAEAAPLNQKRLELYDKMNLLLADRDQVKRAAGELHELLESWEREALIVDLNEARLAALMRSMAADAGSRGPEDWEEGVQAYLALSALARELLISSPQAVKGAAILPELNAIRRQLAFARETDSPQPLDRQQYENFKHEFAKIGELLFNLP
jgi:hypothetical protein